MKRNRTELPLRITAYIVSAIFIIAMLFPLIYIGSLAMQTENAIYTYPPKFVPPMAKSVRIVLDYSKYSDLPEDELKDTILRDATLAMYSTTYELEHAGENIGEVIVYGTMNGKDIFYSRVHNVFLRIQMQFGVYRKCRVEPGVLLYGDRYITSANTIGYTFKADGTVKKNQITSIGSEDILQTVQSQLEGKFQTSGTLSGLQIKSNILLLFENFVQYFKVPQIAYHDYENVRKFSFLAFMGNTFLTVGWVMFCQTMIPAITAYPLSKLLKKKTTSLVLLFFLATMMIPYVVVMIPQLLLIKNLGLLNTYAGMLLPALCPAPFAIYLYKGFFDRIPLSYFEAARIDGAGEVYSFTKICLPMSKSILFLQALQAFLWGWGDFMWYYMVANRPNLWTLNVAIYTFSQMTDAVKQNFLMGMSFATILPILIIASLFSKQIKQSVMGSGIKE